MTMGRNLFFSATILCGLPAASATAEPSAPAVGALAPHRAIYELSLLRSSGANSIVNAHGRIAFDFTGSSCDGYVQNFRQVTEMQPSEGAARVSDMRSATFESGDASNYRFKIETKIENRVAEDTDGKARKPENAKLAIQLVKPKPQQMDFSGEIFFPTEHVRHLIDAARKGETFVEAKVYDGSGDGSKVFDTTAIIGKAASAPPSEKGLQSEQIKSVRRWPVSISYFEPGKKDGQPAYVLSIDMYENGVSGALRLDYGEFALKGEMTELTLLPEKPCAK